MVQRNADLNHAGYDILDSMVDPFFSTSAMQEEAGMPMEYRGIELEILYKFVVYRFPDEKSLYAEENRTFWNPIFNCALNKLYCRDRNGGVAR